MRLLLLGLLTMLLFCQQAMAATGAEQLRVFLDDLVTLEADFKQAVLNARRDQAYSSKGILFLQRPGRFRWDYQEPAGQIVIADGRRVWLIDRELEQVSHQGQDSALRGTPAQLLSDTGPLEQHFEVIEQEPRKELARVELRPRNEEAEFSRILLSFSDNQLREMEMTDNFGQITRFRFSNIKRNLPLNEALFSYEPAPGFDVLGEE